MIEIRYLIVDALNLLGLASDATQKKKSWQRTLARVALAIVLILIPVAVYLLYRGR